MSDITAKQEAFARYFVETGNASEAYRKAYQVGATTKPETIHKRASELLANGEVAGRVAELQSKAAERTGVTVKSLTDELEEARAIAIKEKQASAAVSATLGKAKLHGLGVEHKRVTGSFQLITLTQDLIGKLTPDERTALAAALPVLEKLGAFAEDADSSGTAGD